MHTPSPHPTPVWFITLLHYKYQTKVCNIWCFQLSKKCIGSTLKFPFLKCLNCYSSRIFFKHNGYDLILAGIFTLMAHFDPMIYFCSEFWSWVFENWTTSLRTSDLIPPPPYPQTYFLTLFHFFYSFSKQTFYIP